MASLSAQTMRAAQNYSAPDRAVLPFGGSRPRPDTSKPDHSRLPLVILTCAGVFAVFWSGAAIAFLFGYFGGQGLVRLNPQLLAFLLGIAFLPPLLFMGAAYAVVRALAYAESAREAASVDISVAGTVNGNILSAGHVRIDQEGKVQGAVYAEKLTVCGQVEGGLHARKLELASTCHIKGDVIHEDGAFEVSRSRSDPPLTHHPRTA